MDDIHRRWASVATSRSTDIDESGEVEREDDEDDEDREEGMVDGSGRMDVGNAVDNHELSGIDVMTTLETLYCSCRIFNARCKEARFSNLVSVKILKDVVLK